MGALVLVVDDDDDIASLLLLALDRAGFRSQRASDGVEAVSMAREGHPGLILMDWMMPHKDGVQASKEIRSDATIPPPHIIMLTARLEPEEHDHALRMGVDEIMTKPFRPREVIARVKERLGTES